MGIQVQGSSGTIAEVGGSAFKALHVHIKPLEYGALGHYRMTHRAVLAATQAANARLLELRNTHASNLLVPTRFLIKLYQIAAGTAQMGGLDIFKCTSFSAVDTTNTVTPTYSVKRTTGMAVVGSSIAAIRGVTAAGAAAGMTGGTLTKDGGAFYQHTYAVAAAAGTNNAAIWGPYDIFDDVNGTHPWVYAQNEGFEVENRTLNTTSFGIEAIFDFSWAEVTAY
jgi:hypothetical protein